MQPNVRQGARRAHGAEFKATVLAQCREPGASVAAVANGVNANLVGRGLKRTGPAVQHGGVSTPAVPQVRGDGATPAPVPAGMRFVPVSLAAAVSGGGEAGKAGSALAEIAAGTVAEAVQVQGV